MYDAALILQGGGMRCVYTSGVLDVLMENGIEIKNVYGISAGAKNGQYYISKQIGEAIKVDLYCTHTKKAISFRNMIFNGGMINADYYKNYVLEEFAPLNDNFNKSKQNFYIGITNCLTGEIEYLEGHNCDIKNAIVASCSLPLIQSMVKINNIPYLDGGIAETIPLRTASKTNKKNIIILTREYGYHSEALTKRMRRLYQIKYHKYPRLLNKLLNQNERHNELLDEIYEKDKKGEIFCLYPSKAPNIKVLETNDDKTKALYEMGRQDMINNLDRLLNYLREE